MANLRVVEVVAIDSRTIGASFTEKLDPSIGRSNFDLVSLNVGVGDPEIVDVKITNNIITIHVQPMVANAQYQITFQRTDTQPFQSLNATAFLFEDGITNVIQFLGPEDPANDIRNNLVALLTDGPYNLSKNTLNRTIINSIADNFLRARIDINQTKSDNYLSVLITDERKVRGPGPYDRLDNEGVYEISRVGKNKTNAQASLTFSFDEFPFDPVTLLRSDITNEELEAGNESVDGTFNGFILSLRNEPVTVVTRIVIEYQDGYTFDYDIGALGYQLKQPKYDTAHASTYVLLEDNQVQLNDEILNDPNFIRVPGAGDFIYIDYQYKSLGRYVDPASVTVDQVLDAVREPTPALINDFSLNHAPVVSADDTISGPGGITFLDPNSDTPFLTTPPAFVNEIPFSYGHLPNAIGQFSVDYEAGRIFVYGDDINKLGTGNYPPVATYQYRNSFISGLDYTYDPDTFDLVASPIRELIDETASINFDYEQTLVPDVDYIAQDHKEVLNERIENRLRTTNSLYTTKAPVTNAFRILNETSGEVYGITRFNQNTIYFTSNVPPTIIDTTRERATFTNVTNETLISSDTLTNGSGVRIFQIPLLSDNIIGITEDDIGSSFNTSVAFSDTTIFETEVYFDGQVLTPTENIERLEVGQYQIDYEDGVVYVAVSADQNFALGTVSYKKPVISPLHSHVLAVAGIYYSINPNLPSTQQLDYSGFAEGEVTPTDFALSDERFTDGDVTQPYIISANTITVTDDILHIRHIFDVYDLNNNVVPTDFAEGATFSSNIIELGAEGTAKRDDADVIGAGRTVEVTFISPGIEIGSVSSVVRNSDNVELIDGYETISGNIITLSSMSGAVAGETVTVIYTVVLTSAATPVVDYDRGGYYFDYTYLADEILVSYEYGDNVIDFSQSNAVKKDSVYYVTYKFGALRDSLLANFGSLVDIPDIQVFDTDLPRENYRDLLTGALQSFTKGPTIPAMESLVSNVTKITPEIIEAAFDVWSLGISYLFRNEISIEGEPELGPGYFDQGIIINEVGESVTFPVSSTLRLEEGTLEMWVTPSWNGLDNDATLTIHSIEKDGYAIEASSIYIGASSFNPEFDDDGNFTINKDDDPTPVGLPSAIYTGVGVFIYYDTDTSKWQVLVKDGSSVDGYVYTGSIYTSGSFYDVNYITGLNNPSDTLRTFNDHVQFSLNIESSDGYDGYITPDGYIPGYTFDGFNFMSDDEHYLFDFADSADKNRFSLYKDGSGFMNFVVWDQGARYPQRSTARNRFAVSTDIQDWLAGIPHHVAVAWKLNTIDHRDEMHLFIDGFEVPNIIKYGGRPPATSSEKFRSVNIETVAGTVPKNAIAGNDMATTQGSATVVSPSNDFNEQLIVPGDILRIEETGFSDYTILTVAIDTLVLDGTMPATLADARFSVNPYSVIVSSEIDLASNITVSMLRDDEETEIPGVRASIPGYAISKNAYNQNVLTILGDALVGDQVVIRTLGLNFRRIRTRVYLWGDIQAVLKTQVPPPINLDEVSIIAVLMPLTPIGPANSTITLGNFVATGLSITEPSNATEGRTLSVRITGGNVDFSTATTVTIHGTTAAGPIFETLSFTAAGTQSTTNKFKTTTSVDVTTKPISTSYAGTAVEIKEAYSVTYPDGNSNYPVIRFAFQTQNGSSLEGDGSDTVTDLDGFFPASTVDDIIVISSPSSVAGTYTITERVDNTSVKVTPTPAAAFSGGVYKLYNISIGRSGFQNGFFFLQEAGTSNIAYPLPEGYYDFDFYAYLEAPFNPITQEAHLGSDFNNEKPAKATIDEFRILSVQLTDTRVGEVPESIGSITVDAQAIRPFRKNSNTLMLIHFDEYPLVNDSNYYKFANREYIQSGASVNDNFGQSVLFTQRGLPFNNNGRLTTPTQGTIEFWVSPRYDTYNDPEIRFYFDAASSVVEEVTSISRGQVEISGRAASVESVRLQTDTFDTGINYFAGGTIDDDRQTLNLKQALPFQETPVKVAYIPSGLSGDRVSIFKDSVGFITFNVRAAGTDYQVRTPVLWPRDTWHRVRAMFKFNQPDNLDEIRLFVDGEERGVVLFGSGIIFGDGTVFGQTTVGVTNQILITDINFLDPIHQFFLGQDYLGAHTAQARMDNFRLSDISRNPNTIAGQPMDVNYSSNTDIIFPVIEDAFTTFLLDFENLIEKIDDFAILRDGEFGIFNFTLNIIDSFGIVSGSERIKQVLYAMIHALKPATSLATIKVIQ